MRAKALFLLVVTVGLAAGQEQIESSVNKSSKWFPRNQQEDGSWRAEAGHAPAVTGLVLLAYLGAGYTDRGSERENRYASSVRRGLRYLVARQDEQGRLDENLRHHAIASLAISEAYWMTRNPRYKGPAQRAVDHIARAQREDGGWGDLVTTGWAVMALKSGRFAGLEVTQAHFESVRRWLDRQTLDGENPQLTAAVTTLARIFLGDDPRTDEAIRKGANFCVEHPPSAEKVDRLYWYFATLALFQTGGAYWRKWNESMKEAIVLTQHPRGSGEHAGTWEPVGPTATEFGRAGTTALMTCCLEVYYRYDRVFGVGPSSSEEEEEISEDGLSDAPFVGPETNSAIGLGGGAGGAMRGRGGRRNLRAGGGKGGSSSTPTVRTWKRSSLVPHTSQLKVGDKETLPLEKLEVKVRVDGFRARVVLDCYYRNDRDRQLEGTFQLRLPDEASPYFFAFGAQTVTAAAAGAKPSAWDSFEPEAIVKSREGWTEPKVARVVPRAKAARAYTETVRRRIDPALLEWAGAGVFQARVFPLAPKQLHRIVLAYDVSLTAIGEQLEYRLDLPEKVPALDVALKVDAAHASVTPPAEARDGRYTWKDPVERRFAVRVADPGAVQLRGADDTGPYFAVRFRPDLPATDAGGHRRAVFLIDTSLSSNPERFRVWLRLLRAILENNRDTLEEFAVVCFNIERFRWQEGFVANTPENLERLVPYLEGLALEGATDLAGALRSVAGADADLFLLSDGAATWGPSAMPEIKGALFAYTTGLQGTETVMLQRLARASGGAVFAVTGETEVAAASRAHRRRPWHIFGLAVDGGSDLLLAGRPRSVFPGQTLVLAGRGRPARDAEVVLTLQQGERTHEVRVPPARTLESPLAPRVYGQIAVGQLEEAGVAAEAVAESYAVQFRVPGRTCSLLMLDSEEDYRRFGITPEETALAVRMQPVGETLRRKGEATTRKAELVARLTRLEKIRGLEFKLSAPLRILLDRLPETAFDVRPETLECRERGWRSIPGNISEQLASHELAYDAIAAEAERRRKEAVPADALRALSSLVEEHPGDVAVARDVAYSALEAGFPGHAYHLFRRVAERRPYEPQTYLALADSLAELDSPLAVLYCEVALTAKWSGRVGALHEIGRAKYLRLLRRLAAAGKDTPLRTYVAARLEGLAAELQAADLVVVMEWNTDDTDIDLHVTDPTGEECYYSHDKTMMGGRITADVTSGFGPEMFVLPKAAPGEYLVRAHYYGDSRSRLSMRTRVSVAIVRHWGTDREEVTRKVVTLGRKKEMKELARVPIE